MIDDRLQEDYLTCKKVIDHHSKTFSIGFSVLPSPKKEAVWSLYAFNRRLDDIVDTLKSKELLAKEYQCFLDLQKGNVAPDYIYRTLNDVNCRFGLDYSAMEAMFHGQFQDLAFKNLETDEELLDYCYHVAGSVGQMLLPIIATKNKTQLANSAKNLGIALQITNILRDVGTDYTLGRVYLPSQALQKCGVDLEHTIHSKPDQNYMDLWENYAAMAEKFYDAGLKEIALYDEDSRKAVGAAILGYREILNAVRKQHYSLAKRAVVSTPTKLKLLSEVLASEGFSKSYLL